ncbi:MAG: ferrous iron transport protein B [Bacteroidales bacterium]|nr:ferrous iron transport protein B [Bacteroidales bacterium]
MNLADLDTGQKGIIVKLCGRGAFKRRLSEMGFNRGALVEVIKNAPLRDPIEYKILDYNVSLRRAEAEMIEVEQDANLNENAPFLGTDLGDRFEKVKLGTTINVALVGNPNAGKTTLFNYLSNQNEHVGNYSGVTVGSSVATIHHKGYTIRIVDLPGTYSISSYSPEEVFVRNHIIDAMPDIVLNVVDSGNLHRNLYLTTQLIDMDLQIVMALNMYDDLEKKGAKLDYLHLGNMLGIPMVPTVASKKKGIKLILDKLVEVFEGKNQTVRHIHINYGKGIEKSIKAIQDEIKQPRNHEVTNRISSRFTAIKLLENDDEIQNVVCSLFNAEQVNQIAKDRQRRIEDHLKEDAHTLITDAKYGFIRGALKETLKEGSESISDKTKLIDNFLTHKLFGFPIFIFLIWLMFQSTFWLGAYPMEWIDYIVDAIKNIVSVNMSSGPLKDLIADGIINGVGGVIIFLPNILILFFFISLMEDTGYMARAAFIMDKIMHKIGLHGKSFIPLVMGFGCNVPAIMATRTIENRSERILTILINPFMSCSARLPVYVLITAAVFPEQAGNVIFLIYLIGIILAGLMAIIFKKLFFRKSETPFVMELPPYRVPVLLSTTRHMWHKAAEYLKKMGGIILVASIIVWALGYFPQNISKENAHLASIENVNISLKNGTISSSEHDSIINHKQLEYQNDRLENSYIGRFGKAIEPAIRPLGFDWRLGVSILSGMPAKEIIVSTMGVLFKANDNEVTAVSSVPGSSDNMSQKIRSQVYLSGEHKGKALFSKITAFSFLLFVLIYFPCIATLSAVKKETKSWKWPLFMLFYTSGLAYFMSFAFYQIAHLII